jgi:hypothetical protein
MRTIIDVPEYSPDTGLRTEWDDDFEISVRVQDGQVILVANSAGLRSLARHLLVLAQDAVPQGHHMHFDDSSSLEDGSTELVIEKA